MNTDQIASTIRWFMAVSGPIGAWLVARGMSVENLTALVESIIAVLGSIPPIVAFFWGLKAHTDASKIAAVEDLPDVKAIVAVENPDPDSAVAKAVSNRKLPKVVQG